MDTGSRLREQMASAGLSPLDDKTIASFEGYISLFMRWNERTNLSAVRDEDSIISTHIIESIIVSKNIPATVQTLLDFGSGAGLPGIPIALCRPDIAVTLAESQGKKAAFLREAVRVLGISAKVWAERAEALRETFDCVTLRAVDRMPKAVAAASRLVSASGWLAILTTRADLESLAAAAGEEFRFEEPHSLPGSRERILALASRSKSD